MLGISAIQQLAKENEEMKSKIASLTGRFKLLEAMVTGKQVEN